MGGAHEVAEKIEHVGHEGHGGGHDGGGIAKYIGLTMAILGVLLAVCSAMVGAERTELTKTMVEQANVYNEFQASSTKYRVLLGTLQQLYAQTPSRKLTAEASARLDQIQVPTEQQPELAAQKIIFKETVTLLQPRKSEIEGFLENVGRFQDERKAARAWADSYDGEVKVHFEASEHFEKGQLLAEIGIVIASIALLLHSRLAWFASIGALVGCVGVAGTTWASTKHELAEAKESIHHAEEHYEELRGKKEASGKRLAEVRDDELLAKVRERFGIAEPGPAEAGGHDAHGGAPEPHGAAPAAHDVPAATGKPDHH
jgi:hypothetical protein